VGEVPVVTTLTGMILRVGVGFGGGFGDEDIDGGVGNDIGVVVEGVIGGGVGDIIGGVVEGAIGGGVGDCV
jgi:hypothetical protein